MPDTDNAVAVGFAVQAALASRIQTNSIAPALLAMYEAGRGAGRLDLDSVTRRDREAVRGAFPAFWDVYAVIQGHGDSEESEAEFRQASPVVHNNIERMRSMFSMGYLEAIAVAR